MLSQLLVHAVHVADFAAANSHVAGGAVLVGTDVAPQLGDESLAETHDFGIALSSGVEVGTTLTAAERQVGKAVFENLLETEELKHRNVHLGVETKTALVCAEGSIELYTIAEVGADFTGIVDPGHAECENAIGFDQTLNDFGLLELRVFVVDFFDGGQNLFNSL